MTNEELARAVKAAVGHAYDRYFARLRQLRPDDTPPEDELVTPAPAARAWGRASSRKN